MRFQTVKTEISLANLLTFIHLWTWGQQKVWFSWEPVPITIFFSCLLQLFRVSSLWKQQVHISGVFTASWSWIQSELTDVTVNKHCQLLTLHDFLYLGTQLMYVWVKRGILKKKTMLMIQYLTTIAYKIINLTFALRQIWLKTK